MEAKISSGIGFLIILFVILPTAFLCYNKWLQIEEISAGQVGFSVIKDKSELLTQKDKNKIDMWILKNNLNQYGDEKSTVYPGGSPLFNESTGEQIDKYEYILSKHPNRPWDN